MYVTCNYACPHFQVHISAQCLHHIPLTGQEVLPTVTRPTVHTTETGNPAPPLPYRDAQHRVDNATLLGAGLSLVPAKLDSRIVK